MGVLLPLVLAPAGHPTGRLRPCSCLLPHTHLRDQLEDLVQLLHFGLERLDALAHGLAERERHVAWQRAHAVTRPRVTAGGRRRTWRSLLLATRQRVAIRAPPRAGRRPSLTQRIVVVVAVAALSAAAVAAAAQAGIALGDVACNLRRALQRGAPSIAAVAAVVPR